MIVHTCGTRYSWIEYVHTYIRICVCMFVCMFVWEDQRLFQGNISYIALLPGIALEAAIYKAISCPGGRYKN